MSPRVLLFHPALAPYRVDMFNALSKRCALRLVFLAAKVENQAFDQDRLRALLLVEPAYLLGGISLGGRALRTGLHGEIRRFRPDVVVTSEFGPATATVIASRMLGGGRFGHAVATEDNPASVQEETWLHGLGRRVLLPHTDAVIAYSEEAAALYRDRFGARQPVAASPLVQDEGVIRERLAGAGAEARTAAEAHRLLGRRVLLYVGRLAVEKRVDRLIDCAERIRAAQPDVVLALVGDGPERDALRRRAAPGLERGSVLFVGRQEGAALAAWYRLGSVFALASQYEPFGAVVNEALLAGMPAVCSDRAGSRCLVGPGKNGAVVDAARPEALDAAVLEWLRRTPAVSAEQLAAQRPSLMLSTFDEAVTAYLAALDAARDHRSGPRAS